MENAEKILGAEKIKRLVEKAIEIIRSRCPDGVFTPAGRFKTFEETVTLYKDKAAVWYNNSFGSTDCVIILVNEIK